MTTYLVTASPANGDSTDGESLLAYAFGGLRTTQSAIKDALAAIKDTDGEFTVRVVEVDAIGSIDERRTVVSVTGDADVVTFVTKKKMAAERKAQGVKDANEDLPAGENADPNAAE